MYIKEDIVSGMPYRAISDGNFSFKVFKGDDVTFDYFIANVPKTERLFDLLVSLAITKFKLKASE